MHVAKRKDTRQRRVAQMLARFLLPAGPSPEFPEQMS